MRSRILAGLALAAARVVAPLATPPASAGPDDCPPGNACLFDTPGWGGAWKRTSCEEQRTGAGQLDDRDSVVPVRAPA